MSTVRGPGGLWAGPGACQRQGGEEKAGLGQGLSEREAPQRASGLMPLALSWARKAAACDRRCRFSLARMLET